jgi:hypothetical protein
MSYMTTGFPHADAATAFVRERRRSSLAKFGARLRLVRNGAGGMLPLEQVVDRLGRVAERDLGLQTIALTSIVGTAGRAACEFDGRFRPTSRRTERRWLSVATARRRGRALPPIDVVRVGELHFVHDGHHRVSVARAEGDPVIDARVREIRTRRPATSQLEGLGA